MGQTFSRDSVQQVLLTVLVVLVVLFLRDHAYLLWMDRWSTAKTKCAWCVKEFLHNEEHQQGDGYIANVGNPLFNVRRCAKQCVALEDHLEHPEMRCSRCIQKHFLLMEVLMEEAIGLDRYGRYQSLLLDKPEKIRQIIADYNTRKDYLQTAQKVRDIRHQLTEASFDVIS